MRRLPRPAQVLWLFIQAFVSIVALFVTGIALNLAQVPIILLLVFCNDNSVTANYWGIRGLTFSIQTKIFFRRSTWNMTRLTSISTSTITVSGRRVIILLSLRVFLFPGFLTFQGSIATWVMHIAFLHQQKSLLSCLSFDIHNSLNNYLIIL